MPVVGRVEAGEGITVAYEGAPMATGSGGWTHP
ncbi:MAG: antitoxin (DNA-binding transcriptional repressor) of toxin-antitoxin stability system [Pseudoalteromonas distincta]